MPPGFFVFVYSKGTDWLKIKQLIEFKWSKLSFVNKQAADLKEAHAPTSSHENTIPLWGEGTLKVNLFLKRNLTKTVSITT